jgi:hypothetical protein
MPIKLKQELAGTQETIDGDTEIIRYMKLSTLLLLFADRVFLPSLRCLQGSDRLEGLVPWRITAEYGERLRARLEPFENWLLQTASWRKVERGCQSAIGSNR